MREERKELWRMFPIYLKDAESLPEPTGDPIYFIVANNGVFLVKDLDLYRACVKVEGVPGLLSHEPSVQLKFPKIPQQLVEVCMGFFYEVYRRYRSEAVVLLYFSVAAGFTVAVPEQRVRRWRAAYDNAPSPEGFLKLGTWHSHADLPAYHSHLDTLDEAEEDGLHIVCGDLDTKDPSFSVSFMTNGERFKLKAEEVFEGYTQPIIPPPEDWLERVECVDSRSSSSRLPVESRRSTVGKP